MPGFDRQLARYHSSIAGPDSPTKTDPADGEAALATTRITGGNFRLIARLRAESPGL